jgi:hypothetical protein
MFQRISLRSASSSIDSSDRNGVTVAGTTPFNFAGLFILSCLSGIYDLEL